MFNTNTSFEHSNSCDFNTCHHFRVRQEFYHLAPLQHGFAWDPFSWESRCCVQLSCLRPKQCQDCHIRSKSVESSNVLYHLILILIIWGCVHFTSYWGSSSSCPSMSLQILFNIAPFPDAFNIDLSFGLHPELFGQVFCCLVPFFHLQPSGVTRVYPQRQHPQLQMLVWAKVGSQPRRWLVRWQIYRIQ